MTFILEKKKERKKNILRGKIHSQCYPNGMKKYWYIEQEKGVWKKILRIRKMFNEKM